MPDWTSLRRRAQQYHEHLRRQDQEEIAFLPSAETLLSLAEAETGMERVAVPSHDTLLAGGHAVLDRYADCIWFSQEAAPEISRFAQAHEFAHFWLHPDILKDACQVTDEPDQFSGGEAQSYSTQFEEGYSPSERREREANLFAAEFLLPAPALNRALREGWSVSDIAARVGVTETCVLTQMARVALLVPPSPSNSESPVATTRSPIEPSRLWEEFRVDDSQRAAAIIEPGPVLVEAGPGTGKTRTLIARLLYLLVERNIAPENILALTFSNKAAEEMRTRLYDVVGELADRVWISTFHAFGSEVLRKDGHRIGLPLSPGLMETADAILMLEHNLDRLHLDEYEYLHRPSLPFPDILHCISRAKDELQTPEQYRIAALSLRSMAVKDEEISAAQKALEVAQVYTVYQKLLKESGSVDFGDQIMRTVELFDRYPEARSRWQRQYPHILADEYQDINRASAQLLRRLAGEGAGFWAVGDVRQAIYRFRGASPTNISEFERDFPRGKRIALEVNYRSRSTIVSLFSAAALKIGQTTPARNVPPVSSESTSVNSLWQAIRSDEATPSLTLAVAEDEEAQADGLAASIRDWERSGVALSDQAILCRTNRQAAELSEQLAAREVPTQHLGGLFEREEVKDMLAVLSLASEGTGSALIRVARFPEYSIPDTDVQTLWQAAKEAKRAFPSALALADNLAELSDTGRAGLQRLRSHLAPIAYRGNAWFFLTRYLFETSDYLRPIIADTSLSSRQKLLAIQHLIKAAQELARKLPKGDGEKPQAAFLGYLRHLLACGEERSLRRSEGTEMLEGVRIMTVHASKGLEFPVVYLPNMVKDMFPSRKSGRMATPPPSLFGSEETAQTSDEAGEDYLFFVALSRARDHLILSRPATRRGKDAPPSPLLTALEQAFIACGAHRAVWQRTLTEEMQTDTDVAQTQETESASAHENKMRPTVTLSALEQYQGCPRQYYYQRIARVPDRGGRTAYQAFHICLNATLQWLQDERVAGRRPSMPEAQNRMEVFWMANALEGESAQARMLYENARNMLEHTYRQVTEAQTLLPTEELVVELPQGSVRLRCDQAETQSDVTVRFARTVKRKRKKDDHTAPDLALLREAARQKHPDKSIEIALHYLRDGSTLEVKEQPRYEPNRITKYDAALAGIRNEQFPAQPDDRNCPFCPFFFICPV